ncbi:hypothetical protein EDC04DRAFT_3096327 [Pisolithus marmoratus]|nr:hypothetical protein EDC04DRAFT_3096327 [Pisolithus marmoratus]
MSSVYYTEVSITRNGQTRGCMHLVPGTTISAPQAPRKHQKPTWGLPDTCQQQGVPLRQTWNDSEPSYIKPTTTVLEIRTISAKMAAITQAPSDIPHVERRPTMPDKGRAGTSRFDDTVNRDPADSQQVEKTMLTRSNIQMPPNGLMYPPRTIRDPCRRGRIKTKPENVSESGPRGCKRLMLLSIPISPPRHLSKRLWNVANIYWRKGMPLGRMWNDDKLIIFKTAAFTITVQGQGACALQPSPKREVATMRRGRHNQTMLVHNNGLEAPFAEAIPIY